MQAFFWVFDLLLPVTIMLMGLVFSFRPPRRINFIYGYRTSRSMASQEAWDAAHRIGGRIWLTIGPALVVLAVVLKLIFPTDPDMPVLSFILLGISFAALLVPIIFVERELKKMFDR